MTIYRYTDDKNRSISIVTDSDDLAETLCKTMFKASKIKIPDYCEAEIVTNFTNDRIEKMLALIEDLRESEIDPDLIARCDDILGY